MQSMTVVKDLNPNATTFLDEHEPRNPPVPMDPKNLVENVFSSQENLDDPFKSPVPSRVGTYSGNFIVLIF
jgi:hypothetical protein